MKTDLVQLHHAAYTEDLPFWLAIGAGRDPVLEVGCGHGRVTLPLLEAGCRVVGVDWDRAALDHLNAALSSRPPDLRDRLLVVEGNILNFRAEGVFGAVIIPCNTYSTFPPPDRIDLLDKLYGLLRPEGLLAASLPNPDILLQTRQALLAEAVEAEPEEEAYFTHPETGFPVQVSSRVQATAQGVRWEWIYDLLFPDGQVQREVVGTEHYPGPVSLFLEELAQAGFSGTACQGDFSGQPFEGDSPYLILRTSK